MDRKSNAQASAAAPKEKALLRVLAGEPLSPPPIWLMRQAGRYLPEYRALRRQASGFLDFCYTPELAVEATLQPIRRYGFDASILFSDILVVPDGLGQEVWFEEGHGPRLRALEDEAALERLSAGKLRTRLDPVYRTVERLRDCLPQETTLIGFAGAPWTVATYMLEGRSSRDFAKARQWMTERPEAFARLIDLLVEATCEHLLAQVETGAEVVQIFDSWASALQGEEIRRWSLAPLREIVTRLKAAHPGLPVILFPRGAGEAYHDYALESGADALSLDPTVPLDWARDELQTRLTVQGSLDPKILVAGGAQLDEAVGRLLETLGQGPFIFNLGHGIVPETPPENVERLLELVRGTKA